VGEAKVSAQCYASVTEELSRGWMSLADAMGGHTVVAKLLVTYGTREQQDIHPPKMATGEVRAAMALTEPGGGSDLQALRTTARRDGDGYVVNGSKTWITSARRSQLIALLCKTDPDAKPTHKGSRVKGRLRRRCAAGPLARSLTRACPLARDGTCAEKAATGSVQHALLTAHTRETAGQAPP
jgi:hypothetical protein